MDREYIICNICDHFAFNDDVDIARNMSVEFVIDYFKKYNMNIDDLYYILSAIVNLWLFCKNEKVN